MNELTTLQLTPEEVNLFIEFQKHYRFISSLLTEIDKQKMKEGYITMHFTKTGEIGRWDLLQVFNQFKIVLPM